MGARLRRPYRRFDDRDAFGAEDLVEVAAELTVAISDPNCRADSVVVELHHQVAPLLGHPPAVRIGRDSPRRGRVWLRVDEEQDAEPLQDERVDGEEVALEDARRLARRNPAQLSSARLDAGSIP